ncbi:hypothetical protein [Calycomorphotria hydatis]|uniref:Uncharacterized protein n=1 Tax=Calycomorphotria hydatis TaxID=2528027 RepID=A0A517T378_9PLAN|nr:hypothetical protein [Calycomorphotria hydatis]QDT62828.1 hypothetical protein V22_00260 [Calycomorphotria hydatis]
MNITAEQRAALAAHPEGIRISDEETGKVYVLADEQHYRQAMAALRKEADLAAIQAGIDDMEAGRMIPLEEVDFELRTLLKLPPRKP